MFDYSKRKGVNRLEAVDSKPMTLPVGFKKPEAISDTIARLVDRRFTRMRDETVDESVEDASDFNISDDRADPTTPWEKGMDATDPFLRAAVEKASVERRARYEASLKASKLKSDGKDPLSVLSPAERASYDAYKASELAKARKEALPPQ